jgi:DNA-binding Xre family transcriptional regulator
MSLINDNIIVNRLNEMYNDFSRLYPDVERKVIDWYQYGRKKLIVITEDRSEYLYDYTSKNCICLKNANNDISMSEEEWKRKFSKSLKNKMLWNCIGQDELADLTGISKVTLSKYMNMKSTPSAHNIYRLAKALKCLPSELIDPNL